MSSSTNTRSGPTTSTETTTLATDPSNPSYVTQYDFTTTIKYLMSEFKEYLNEIIAYQDDKVVKNIEK